MSVEEDIQGEHSTLGVLFTGHDLDLNHNAREALDGLGGLLTKAEYLNKPARASEILDVLMRHRGIVEESQGKVRSRVKAFLEERGEVVLIIDDDNLRNILKAIFGDSESGRPNAVTYASYTEASEAGVKLEDGVITVMVGNERARVCMALFDMQIGGVRADEFVRQLKENAEDDGGGGDSGSFPTARGGNVAA